MNQRDRYWTTLIIWLAFTILMIIVFDRVLLVQADFTGLFPPEQTYQYPLAQDAETLNQVLAAARDASPALLAQVQQSIHDQIAQRLPLVMALAVAFIAAATLCTWFVWRNAGLEAYLAREVVQAEKVKRRSRIEQFMEDLDSDELDQLRTRLGDEDGIKLRR
jgi:hypothetical protein